MKKISVTELTPISFAPYGRVVENYDGAITKQGEHWICYSPVDFILPDAPMGFGIVYSDEVPEKITAMERHVSREEVLWATNEDLIMLVDLPIYLGAGDARPNPETTKAFLIKAGQVVVINRGTWHSPAFAVSGKAKYYFMVEFKKDLIDQDHDPWIPFENDESIMVSGE
ncbi:ureidoglycolate lyase [Lachnospiraceae bacterium 62-35]